MKEVEEGVEGKIFRGRSRG